MFEFQLFLVEVGAFAAIFPWLLIRDAKDKDSASIACLIAIVNLVYMMIFVIVIGSLYGYDNNFSVLNDPRYWWEFAQSVMQSVIWEGVFIVVFEILFRVQQTVAKRHLWPLQKRVRELKRQVAIKETRERIKKLEEQK